MSSEKTLFSDARPDIIFMKDLYDPDDPDSGNVIPTVGTLVCLEPGSNIYYSVIFVHTITHKSTLAPLGTIAINGDKLTSIVDYANNKFRVFYDDRVEPTTLNIDSLLTIFGVANAEYKLKRTDPLTREIQTISVYYDSDGVYRGDRIPLKLNAATNSKYCSDCHTLVSLVDNELITMEVYNTSGAMSAEVTLFTQRANILNNHDVTPIITDFQLACTQVKGDVFFLYEKQDISALILTPTIIYNTGATEVVPVDNVTCFLYGAEDFITSYPGLRQTLMCKYFLRTSQMAENAMDDGHGRFVVVEKDVVTVARSTPFSVKISIVPRWNSTTGKYDLRFYLYTTQRTSMYDVTDKVQLLAPYYGDNFDSTQALSYKLELQDLFSLSESSIYVQNTWLRLKPYNFGVERYIIKDSANNENAYGVESSVCRRPVIHYDTTLGQYFIPTSVFQNAEAFVEATYTKSNPPYDNSIELLPLVPTHFTVRDPITRNTVIASPIPIAEYSQAWIPMVSGLASQFVGGLVLIEFLIYTADTYNVIYGVPVDVYLSELGYNV